MATSRRNVDLVIRARDEGTKAFEAAVRALQSLNAAGDGVTGSATQASSRLQQLVAVATTVDRAFSQISGAADQAAASIQRQQAVIAEQQAQLAALKGQAESAAQAISRIQTAIVDRVLAGGNTSGLVTQLQAAKTAAATFDKEIIKLTGSIEREQATIAGSRSSLQQLGSTTLAAEAAKEQLTAQVAAETRALEQQTAAAQRNAQVLGNVERVTGVNRDKSELNLLAEQIEAHNALIGKLKAEQAAQNALNDAQERGARIAREHMGTLGGKSARDSASVFEAAFKEGLEDESQILRANAAATKDMADAAQRLKAQLNPLAVIEDRLNKELAEANALYKAGKISATELAQATNLLKANAQNAADALGRQSAGIGKPRLFGLKPYEVQNLSFQINDVFTQLASGTSVTQTLAQQGGQLLQIFPRVGSAIIKAFTNPVILAFAAAVGLVVLAFRDLGKETARLRELEGAIAVVGDRAGVTAESLAEAADELDRFGLSAKDAVAAVRAFNKEGINPDRIVQFGQAAQNLAVITGKEVPEAAEELAKAFSGGASAILKLDDSFDFLSATERDYVQNLFVQGRAMEARTFAFEKFKVQASDVAAKMRGPWSQAANSLGNAWNTFLGILSDSSILRGWASDLDGLGVAVTGLLNRLAGARSTRDIDAEIGLLQRRINDLNADIAAGDDPFQANTRWVKAYTAALERLREEREKLIEQNRELADSDTVRFSAEQIARANKQRLADKDEEIVKNKQISASERLAAAERIATREWEQYYDQEHLRAVDEAVQQEDLRNRLTAARLAVEEQITREREQQRREWLRDIQDNADRDQGQRLNETAQRFSGFNETRNRGDLQAFFNENGISVDPEMTAWCAAFVNAVLAANGLKGTGSLAAKSFLGFGEETKDPQVGDIVILNRGPNPAEGHVGFFQGFDENGNVRVLGGNQRDGVNTQTFDRGDVVGFRRAPSQVDIQKEDLKLLADLEAAQRKFNDALLEENDRRSIANASLRLKAGLQGEELIREERRQFIADEINKRQEDLDAILDGINDKRAAIGLPLLEQALELTEQQKAAIEALAGAEFDLMNARRLADEQRRTVDQPVQDLTAQRNELQQQIEFLREMGNFAAADALLPQLDAVNLKLAEAIEKARLFWAEVLAGGPAAAAAYGLTVEQVENMILALETAKLSTQTLGTFMGIDLRQAAQRFASGAASAFDRFAQGIAEGKNVLTSLKEAFLQFAADFLRQISQMIIQQYAYNFALMIARALGGGPAPGAGAPTGGGGGAPGFGPGFSLFHQGGVVGEDSVPTRVVDSSWFRNAMRYHGGGIAGLRPGEVPAILKRGEEVLTEDDPRHVGNGGGGGPAPMKNVVVFNPADVLSWALADQVGEKVFLTYLRRNSQAVQAALGG